MKRVHAWKKVASWAMALALTVGLVPASLAVSADAAETADGEKEMWEIALENGYTHYDTIDMCGGNSHLQGICVDDKMEYMYFSYTSALAKVDMKTGEVVGSVGGFGQGSFGTPGGAHLGCLAYYDGKIYGIPFTRQVIGYFYNKDLFAQAGIEKPAETWDEFFEQCDKLLAAGITPLSMDTADSGWVTSLWLGAMIASNDAGEEFMNTIQPKDYNTPEFIDAATKIQQMFQKYTTSDAVGGAYENAASNFYMEETAMIANGPWMISDFYDTSLVEEGFADKIGTAMFPGGVMYNSGKIGFNIASKDEEKLQAALTFVDFLTSEESQVKMLEMTGETPAMEGVSSDNVKPLVNEVINNGDNATRCINDFQSLWYANVVDEISVQYPLLAQGEITPEQFAQALTDAAAKN